MDAAEFDDFYAASFRPAVRQLYALIGDAEEARDCVQEAFIRAWSNRRALDVTGQPEAWIRTTAHRLAISRWRRRVRARRAPDRALTPPASVPGAGPERVALMTALQQLPYPQRQALVLHHLADLPVAAIAAEVGAPEGTVKARLARGRAALANLLADDLEEGVSRA